MEQLEVPVEAKVATMSLRRSLSAEVRASLEAVEEAQSAAKARARQETARTRIGFALVAGAVALVAVAVVPRMARGRHAPVQTAAAAPAAVSAPPTSPSAAVPSPLETPDRPTPAPAAAAVPGTAPDVAPTEGCDTALIQKSPWRLSPQACVRAFASDPTNADLALAIAHAEHAHGSPTASAEWAQRALSLDANSAEAYVLIARAALKGRHPEEARAAYRHYLQLAPRGWHQREARAALRPARTE